MVPFLILIVAVFIMAIVLLRNSSNEEQSATTATPRTSRKEVTFTEKDLIGNDDGTMLIEVAGINHHAHGLRPGGVWGIAMPEPTNQYNNRAVAIIAIPGKKLGYVSEMELEEYRKWCGGKPCVFIGFIREYASGRFSSHVMCIKASSEENLKQAIAKQQQYLKGYRKEDGINYSPKVTLFD